MIIIWLGNYFDDVCDKMPTKNEYYSIFHFLEQYQRETELISG
jgi:hypothetical protein